MAGLMDGFGGGEVFIVKYTDGSRGIKMELHDIDESGCRTNVVELTKEQAVEVRDGLSEAIDRVDDF